MDMDNSAVIVGGGIEEDIDEMNGDGKNCVKIT